MIWLEAVKFPAVIWARAYLIAIVTICAELSLSPIFSTTGCGPELIPSGTIALKLEHT